MRKKVSMLLVMIFVAYLFLPLLEVNAETLKEYKDLLNKYENEQRQNQS